MPNDANTDGLVTAPQISPVVRFTLPKADREAMPVPPSKRGHCELCGLPLSEGELKFHRDRHGFSCRTEFYRVVQQAGIAIAARELLIRRTRPRRKGEPVPEAAKQARREIQQLTDELDRRIREGARLLETGGKTDG